MASQVHEQERSTSRLVVLVTGFVLVIGTAGALFVEYALPGDPVLDMADACKSKGWSYHDDQTSDFKPRCMDENGVLHFVPQS